MKTLKTLIRLKKEDVEKLQKELSAILERQRRLQEEHDDLGQELEREIQAAAEFPESAVGFGIFAKRVVERQKLLLNNIAMLQKSIDKKRDELMIEFSEQKKFEIALEQQQMAELKATKKRDAIRMDEVAARGYSKKE